MTIFGVGYRSLEYQVRPPHERWWPVLAEEFRTLFRSRWGVFLFIGCLLPTLASLGVLLLQMGVLRIGPVDFNFAGVMQQGPPRLDARSVSFYVEPVYSEGLLPFLVLTFLVASRSIAKDRQTNALEIYWTRGIGPVEYFLAKWLGSVCLLGLPFVVAPLVLWLLGVIIAEDWSFLGDTVGFMPAALASTALFTLFLSYMSVAASAMTKSPNLSAVLWLFLISGTQILGNMLRLIFDENWLLAVSPWESMGRVVQWICGIDPLRFQEFSPAVAVASLAAYLLVLTAIMVRRLRLQEAVA